MPLNLSQVLSATNYGAHALTWVDLETSGTEQYDSIIEIGAIMTDFNFEQIGEEFECVVDADEFALGRILKTPPVYEMHKANGLLDELIAGRGTNIDNAQKELMRWVDWQLNLKKRKGPVEKYRFQLAGSGVGHFDRRFIKEHLPQFDRILTFSPLDIGNLRRFLKYAGCELAGAPSSDDKNHRALDDIRLHLEEARFYRERLRDVFVRS